MPHLAQIVQCQSCVTFLNANHIVNICQLGDSVLCWLIVRVPTHPGILEKFLNFILKVQGLEIYLNFVKNPGFFNKILEKGAVILSCNYFGGILHTNCLKYSFPQKSIPTKLRKGSLIFSVKALENVKNVLKNTLEKSLNFVNAKVWESCEV